MTKWQTGKYLFIIALQNDAAKNSSWRSTSALTLRASSNSSEDRKSKGTTLTTSFKKANVSNGNFSGNGSKGFSNPNK
jgi:hypothetical protein